MKVNLTKFESLSDQIMIHIFQYLTSQHIFHSFYHINIRFNNLIESLNNLHLIISENESNENMNIIHPYIRSLITIGHVNINLENFTNIRRLIMYHPTEKLLKQFDLDILSNLECLIIPDNLYGMSNINRKIFSNQYSKLKYCHLYGYEAVDTILKWTQTLSLKILKIGFIDFHVFKSILSSCPNLCNLKLELFQSYLRLTDIFEHRNLRKLEIYSNINDYRYNDQLIDKFVSCVPYLHELTIHQTMPISKIIDIRNDYDWHASIIQIRLIFLKYFCFYLYLEHDLEFTNFLNAETRRQIRKFFTNFHQNNRYQSRFLIK